MEIDSTSNYSARSPESDKAQSSELDDAQEILLRETFPFWSSKNNNNNNSIGGSSISSRLVNGQREQQHQQPSYLGEDDLHLKTRWAFAYAYCEKEQVIIRN